MKLGLISYSNSYPFLLEMQRHPIAGVDLDIQIPGELNRRLHSGELDMSAVSAFEYLKNATEYFLLPQWCINSKGAVKSVLLFSKCPWSELNQKIVMLTGHSATSVNLLKILFHHHHLQPKAWLPHEHNQESKCDALLLIGDPALRFHDPEFPYVVDLAEEWQKITQLPIVFAVQAIRRDRWKGQKENVQTILSLYDRVSSRLQHEGLGQDLPLMAKAFPDLAQDFEHYFKCLDFTFSATCLEGLKLYAKKLVDIQGLTFSPTLTPAPL
jgi:chorismate dehydratase